MKKTTTLIICYLLALSGFSQIEMEQKGNDLSLYLDKGRLELVSFSRNDFITTETGTRSVVTNFDEIEHHWVVRGLIEGKDSVKFIAAFYKLSKKDTLIFTVGLSDTAISVTTLKFNYQKGAEVYTPVTKGSSKNLRGKARFTYLPGSKATSAFYTDKGFGMIIENNAKAVYDFSDARFFTIQVSQLPIHGKLFYTEEK